jgi:hypothetical protein
MSSVPYIYYLSVTPSSASIALGETAQLKAVATYSDGTTRDVSDSVEWRTQNEAIASINSSGMASSVAVGKTLVTASQNGVEGIVTLTVSNAVLQSIAIDAAASPVFMGQTLQLHASGTYSDRSVQDITDQVSWKAAQSGVASINAKGLVSPIAVGSTQITGALNGITASSQITVAPAALVSIAVQGKAAALPVGTSEQLNAVGTFTDGTMENLTSAVSWTSSSSNIVSTTASGVVTARAAGNAAIMASLNGASGVANLTASSAALVSIVVSANKSTLPLGTNGQLTAIGTYTDGSKNDLTQTVTWASSSPKAIAISSPGVVSAKSIGAANISASLSNITGTTNLNASAATLTTIVVTAKPASIPVGNTVQLKATGTYTDGSSQDLTSSASWTSSSPNVAVIRSPGQVVGVSMGAANLIASSGSVQGTANLNVSAAVLTSLALVPAAPTVPLGSSTQLMVTGVFSDGSTQDVTSQVSWNVSTPSIASMNASGLATGQKVGTTGVAASLNGIQIDGTLTVQPLLTVTYFDVTSGNDSTIRITNPAVTGQDLCTMIYVFDQNQQMSECCGCLVSQDGLVTLSLNKNLLNNPLTGVSSKAGTLMLVTADHSANLACNASAIAPDGTAVAWSTHLLQTGKVSSGLVPSTEDTFSTMPLSSMLSSALQAQCAFIQQLGSGQGICSCGSGAN